MSDFSASIANLALIEELYAKFKADPNSVDASWKKFFEGVDFCQYLYKKEAPITTVGDDLAQKYRREGHLFARFNPLQEPAGVNLEEHPLKAVYCGSVGFEYMDLGKPELEKWLQARIEGGQAELKLEEKQLLLEMLVKSEAFETHLHAKYPGQTRFSLEGAETMIPILAEVLQKGKALGVEEAVIGMAHRGRLNVLSAILNKSYGAIFEEFEDDMSLSFAGSDDVKYHMGAVGNWDKIVVELAANPSHLESVDPVVLGKVKAKQILKSVDRVLPLLIHGDASIAGQGVIYESLQLMNLPAYTVGGAIHLVVNNQIGYTTLPEEGRSTRYCTDIAKTFGAPVFHVNAEDPESCLWVAKLALEIRQTFHLDVFIDLLCYRKYGHNEGDEPSFTQPVQYKAIREKKSIRQLYSEKLMSDGLAEQTLAKFQKELAETAVHRTVKETSAPISLEPVATAVNGKMLSEALGIFCAVPKGFHPHPKLEKWLQTRQASKVIDWSTAEMLAFGALLLQGNAVRLAGQDSQRGTFSQRHMVWMDYETGDSYCPFKAIQKARFDVVNSPLTEYAGMGFEYGYSLDTQGLVLWEAQYGDFDNGAQIIIDQYIASGEKKWNCPSRLTLLLPHGYEGAGPEHSSARMERFLQLAANDNMQIVNPTTPSQYFHLLRRQALQKDKKPLIVFTPKSLLRSKACVSTMSDLENGFFEGMLDDPAPPKKCKRLLFCSGKVFYDLLAARKRDDIAIVRIEELYPLDEEKLQAMLAKYKGFSEIFWVQEEPENMGAWRYISSYLPNAKYIGRAANATTATGSSKKSKQEQAAYIEKAIS